MQPTFPLLSERTKSREESSSFSGHSATRSPRPSPKGRGSLSSNSCRTGRMITSEKLSSVLVLQFQVLTRTLESVDKFADVVISLELVHPKVETIEIAIRRIVGIAL